MLSHITIPSDKYVTFVTKQKYTIHLKYYLTTKQEKEVITTLGYVCFVILNHYLRKASMDDHNFNDSLVTKDLGIPLRTVSDTRRKLIQSGWFIQRTFRSAGVTPIIATAIGKEQVQALKARTTGSFQKMFNEYRISRK